MTPGGLITASLEIAALASGNISKHYQIMNVEFVNIRTCLT
ncbi:hypothetical protein A225_2985 [Klebsiella michiganensis E718]|nr:hypothetical protein A225_2985 [Klebsiella michiganensis E718]